MPDRTHTRLLGAGDGRALEFADTLPEHPVRAGTVTVRAMVKGQEWLVTDDGDGAWGVGFRAVGGWLHYETGYCHVEFPEPPDAGIEVVVTYRSEAP